MFKKYSFINNEIIDYKYAKYQDNIEHFIPDNQMKKDVKFFITENGNGEFKFDIKARFIKLVAIEWSEQISGRFDVLVDNQIQNTPEQNRSYSSIFNNDSIGTGHARSMIDSEQAWTSASNLVGEWMQVDIGDIKNVTGLKILKRKDNDQHIKKFIIQYSSDNINFNYIKIDNDSNVRKYNFLFDGCPKNVNELEQKIEGNENTFDSCANQCNLNDECKFFEISGCSGLDHDPTCKGTCKLYGEGNAILDGQCDISGVLKTFSKKMSELENNQILEIDDYLVSSNGKYYLVMRDTGNLVLYNQLDFNENNIIWKSTEDKEISDYFAVLSNEGVMIIYEGTDLFNKSEEIWRAEKIVTDNDTFGEVLKYNTPFKLSVLEYPSNEFIPTIKFINANDVQSNENVKYNDKVHIVKADNDYEIAHFSELGEGAKRLRFINTFGTENKENFSFYIKSKLDGNKAIFTNEDDVKINQEISITITNTDLTENCGWWGCRVLKPSGSFGHGGKDPLLVPTLKVGNDRYVFKVNDDGNIVLNKKKQLGDETIWQSNTNYEFLFNGCPKNLNKIISDPELVNETYLSCAKKCNEETSCTAFEINECSGNDNYPKCTGKCILYSGLGIPENGALDDDSVCVSTGKQKSYKKVVNILGFGDITETAAEVRKQFTNITTNLFGSTDETDTENDQSENTEETTEETNDDTKTESSGSGINSMILILIILALLIWFLCKRKIKL